MNRSSGGRQHKPLPKSCPTQLILSDRSEQSEFIYLPRPNAVHRIHISKSQPRWNHYFMAHATFQRVLVSIQVAEQDSSLGGVAARAEPHTRLPILAQWPINVANQSTQSMFYVKKEIDRRSIPIRTPGGSPTVNL